MGMSDIESALQHKLKVSIMRVSAEEELEQCA